MRLRNQNGEPRPKLVPCCAGIAGGHARCSVVDPRSQVESPPPELLTLQMRLCSGARLIENAPAGFTVSKTGDRKNTPAGLFPLLSPSRYLEVSIGRRQKTPPSRVVGGLQETRNGDFCVCVSQRERRLCVSWLTSVVIVVRVQCALCSLRCNVRDGSILV